MERWKIEVVNVFREIVLCFAIFLMGYGLHPRSPWGGEGDFVDFVAWSVFLIDVGLVGKTICGLYNKERKFQRHVQIMQSDRELKELKRLGKMRKMNGQKERRRLIITSTCQRRLQDVE